MASVLLLLLRGRRGQGACQRGHFVENARSINGALGRTLLPLIRAANELGNVRSSAMQSQEELPRILGRTSPHTAGNLDRRSISRHPIRENTGMLPSSSRPRELARESPASRAARDSRRVPETTNVDTAKETDREDENRVCTYAGVRPGSPKSLCPRAPNRRSLRGRETRESPTRTVFVPERHAHAAKPGHSLASRLDNPCLARAYMDGVMWRWFRVHARPGSNSPRCSSRRCPTVPQVRADITARTCSSSLWQQQQRQQQYEKPSQRQQCQ
ncbi:unnamed protein product [Lampetra fluviatilis]